MLQDHIPFPTLLLHFELGDLGVNLGRCSITKLQPQPLTGHFAPSAPTGPQETLKEKLRQALPV